MTVSLFIILITILSLVASLLTEAIKKVLGKKEYSINILVGVVSAVCGWAGGFITYIFMKIPFDIVSILALILLAPAVWLVATLGYDKVMQTIKQMIDITPKK